MDKTLKTVDKLLRKSSLKLAVTNDGIKVLTAEDECAPLLSSQRLLQKTFLEKENIFLNGGQLQSIIEYLEIHPLTDDTVYETACRIHNGKDYLAYELNRDTGECVVITPEEILIEQAPQIIFKHSSDFQNQVEPDWDVEVDDIFALVHKHFNLKNERQEKLLILYLITSFWGMQINHPLLILTGEKASSKSTTMRKLEKLIDPKTSNLCGMPKGTDGLELRLSSTYFVALDNLSHISRNVSDTIARAVTGGSVTKRALYHNTKEIVLNIKALVAINGVSLVAKESDLLDRALILELERIAPSKIKSEQSLWESFEEDRPKFLGCIFYVLSEALYDTEEVKVKEKVRLADFHIACILVGRVLGMTDEEVSELLWENQKNVNHHCIDEDIVACCLLELMSRKKSYVNSMTGLLHDLGQIANRNSIVSSVLPKTPNHLTVRLNKIKSNLQSEYHITYNIVNVGAFKEITIKNTGKVCESCDKKVSSKSKKG